MFGLQPFRLGNAQAPGGVLTLEPSRVRVGARAELTFVPTGHPAPTIEWIHAGALMAQQARDSLILESVTSDDAGEYAARLINDAGTNLTAAVRLDVVAAPRVRGIFGPTRVLFGEAARWSVEAEGELPLSYQWYQGEPGDQTHPVGANTPELALSSVTSDLSLWVSVIDDLGWVASEATPIHVESRRASVVLGNLEQVADGNPKQPTSLTEPPGLLVSITFDGTTNPPTEPGQYAVVATVTEAGYEGSAKALFELRPPGGRVEAQVYEDADGDGRMGRSDPGLADVTLSLRGDGQDRQAISDASGRVRISGLTAGTYLLEVSLPPGWTSVGALTRMVTLDSDSPGPLTEFGVLQAGTLVGRAFFDVDDNGVDGLGEDGVAGVEVRIRSGLGSNPSEWTAVSDAQGRFRVSGLATGTVTLEAQPPAGWAPRSSGSRTLMVGPATSAAVGLAFRQVQTIAGRIFEDRDGDGQRGEWEAGIENISIELRASSNGEIMARTVSDSEGTFRFLDLPPGDYQIAQQLTPGWIGADRASGGNSPGLQSNARAPAPVGREVTLVPGGTVTTAIGLHAVGRITGRVTSGWTDVPGVGRSGMRMEVFQIPGGRRLAVTHTDADGAYSVEGIEAGRCQIVVLAPGSVVPSSNSAWVTLDGSNAGVANFVMPRPGVVSGQVFNDENRDGLWQPGEPGVGGLRVVLRTSATSELSVFSGGDGTYLFADAPMGEARLEMPIPEGFETVSTNHVLLTMTEGVSMFRTLALLPLNRPQPWGQAYGRWADDSNLALTTRAPEADPDRDDMPNLLEYLQGTQPNAADPDAGPKPSIIRTARGPIAGFLLRRRHGATGARAMLEVSSDLLHWRRIEPTVTQVSVGEEANVVRILDPEPFGRVGTRFLRLGVEPALGPSGR